MVGPAEPRTQHDCHHNIKVKPEAATAVELLMMGGKTPDVPAGIPTGYLQNTTQKYYHLSQLAQCTAWIK
jgi:hypothetical protein